MTSGKRGNNLLHNMPMLQRVLHLLPLARKDDRSHFYLPVLKSILLELWLQHFRRFEVCRAVHS
jgi:hypothetical protein